MSGMTFAPEQASSTPSPLKIGRPDDALEREADRKAEEVMRDPRPATGWPISRMSVQPPLQRKCSCGAGSSPGECAECQAAQPLQRKAAGAHGPSAAPPVVHEVLGASGRPLDAAARGFFEPRFGHDLSRVRLHRGGREDESLRAVNALAYTVGHHIVLGSGVPAQSWAGRQLLAHELTHAIQQSADVARTAPSPRST